jgi:hypothetical protein
MIIIKKKTQNKCKVECRPTRTPDKSEGRVKVSWSSYKLNNHVSKKLPNMRIYCLYMYLHYENCYSPLIVFSNEFHTSCLSWEQIVSSETAVSQFYIYTRKEFQNVKHCNFLSTQFWMFIFQKYIFWMFAFRECIFTIRECWLALISAFD